MSYVLLKKNMFAWSVASTVLTLVAIGVFALKDRVQRFCRGLAVDVMVRVVEKAQKRTKVSAAKLVDTEMAMEIPYQRNDNSYTIWIPYCRKLVPKMSAIRVFLRLKDGSKVDITQQPGIPYHVCAAVLGGEAIEAINLDTGTRKEYADTDIPLFMRDLL